MSKMKRKTKTPETVPPPIKIKKEKTEDERVLYPISHYVDDHLEMIKQIFSTLKPKTITNLTPFFLKNESIEHIEELCLAELVCISKKRLLSIINATECPSDTDSSNDSDVEQQEEHVSLEEISSGSELEEGATNGVGRKRMHRMRMAGKPKMNGVSVATNGIKQEANGKKTDGTGQISVLELLELQARARAIRSQLALEPITKIELNSDDEKADATSQDKPGTSNNDNVSVSDQRKRKTIEEQQNDEVAATAAVVANDTAVPVALTSENGAKVHSNGGADAESSDAPRKRIKLKRHSKPADDMTPNDELAAQTPAAPTDEAETLERSPSPDIIPIVPEPETVEILDSSDDNDDDADKEALANVEKAAAVVPAVVAVNGSATGGDAGNASAAAIVVEIEEGEISESDSEAETPKADQPTSDAAAVLVVDVVGESDNHANEKPPIVEESVSKEQSEMDENLAESAKVVGVEEPTTAKAQDPVGSTETDEETAPLTEDVCSRQKGDIEEDNDDVISLEGGDLESEMIEHLVDDDMSQLSGNGSAPSPHKSDKQKAADTDVISLESSEAEEIDSDDAGRRAKNSSESWKLRYMKSDKMSKLLAQARLSKRVRDNIKRSKKQQQAPPAAVAVDIVTEADANSQDTQFSSKHEDGSIEQYKELLEYQQQQQQQQQLKP